MQWRGNRKSNNVEDRRGMKKENKLWLYLQSCQRGQAFEKQLSSSKAWFFGSSLHCFILNGDDHRPVKGPSFRGSIVIGRIVGAVPFGNNPLR